MPIDLLARHLADLDLDGYRVNSSVYGNTLRSLSMTPGVRIVDPSLSNPGRSCTCYTCWGCVCDVPDDNQFAGLHDSHED
jgi:hypothetical protein